MAEETPLDVADAIVFTDGGARGNPGPAGCGAVLKSLDGRILAEESRYLGETTNNVAEYQGLLLGLQTALEFGVKRLEVRADSELLIKQLRGEYRVRHFGLKPLYEAAKSLLARFERVALTHVRRELNGEADRLANCGIDQGLSITADQLTSPGSVLEGDGVTSASKSSDK